MPPSKLDTVLAARKAQVSHARTSTLSGLRKYGDVDSDDDDDDDDDDAPITSASSTSPAKVDPARAQPARIGRGR